MWRGETSPLLEYGMDFDFQVLRLTDAFYQEYSDTEKYHELLLKEQRAYNCLLLDLHYDYFICIPYRSDIRHRNAFKFQNSERSKQHQSGLDYSKMVIVKKTEYLANRDASIDQDEYKETVRHIRQIADEANRYLTDYIKHTKGEIHLAMREYERKYRFSTLPYFHKELAITEVE